MTHPAESTDTPPSHAWRHIIEMVDDCGLILLDTQGIIRSWNSGAQSITGMTETDAIGRPFADLFECRSTSDTFGKYDSASASASGNCTGEHCLIHPSGQRVTVRVRTSPYFDGETLAGVGVILKDISEEILSQQQIQASEIRYRTLLNHATDAYFLHKHGGIIMDMNDRACENLGYSRDELLGKTPAVFATSLSPEKLRDLTNQLDSGATIAYESLHRRKNGSTFPVEVRIRPFILDGERCAITLIRDITERKRAEQTLRESEERYRLAFNTLQLGMWRHEIDSGLVSLDYQSQLHYGFSTPVITIRQMLDRIHPDDAGAVTAEFLRARGSESSEQTFSIEHRIQLPDGTVRWLSVRSIAHFAGEAEQRKAVCLVGTTLDVTSGRFSEATLRGQSRIFELIATGEPLHHVLEEITRLIEDQIPESFCSIMLRDRDGVRLVRAAGSRMPVVCLPSFTEQLDGWSTVTSEDSVPAGVSVITPDIQTDCRWQHLHEFAAENGLRSFWQVPIFAADYASEHSAESPLAGIVAVCRKISGGPDQQAQVSLATAAHLAGVAAGNARAVQEIRDSEARYRLISEITRSVTFAMSRDAERKWHFDWSRPRFGLLSGYSQEEVNAIGWESLIHPDDRQKVSDVLKRLVAGATIKEELRYLTKHGNVLDVQLYARLLESNRAKGTLTVIGGLLDITEFKSIEFALRKSEEFLRRAQNMAHVGSWTFNLKSRFFDCSEEAASIYELNGATCSWAQWKRLVHPDDLERVCRAFESALAEKPFELEHRLVVAGRTKWVSVKASLETDADGRAAHVMGITQDISARRRLEEQLRHSQKMEAFGQLAGGVAHDFNNLLTVINGYSEILLSEIASNKPEHAWVTQIREAGERASVLTRQLLMLSRKQFMAPRIIDLNLIISRSETMLRRLIGEDIMVETSLDRNLPPIKADPGQIDQVLLNLAVNSRDAMPEGGRLTITTSQITITDTGFVSDAQNDILVGRYARVTVSDTGRGMTEEVRSRIYEPFFSTKGIGKGTGLGLATVYGIVKQNGGHIAVESEPGMGTTFRILFPVSHPESAAAETAISTTPPLRGTETILLAEDESSVRQLAVTSLESLGYTVLEADSGESAILAASRHEGPLHLLITDVVMPRIGGTELASRLRLLHPNIVVLYMSGYTDNAVVRRGVFTGLDYFIQKPFTPAVFARRVQEILHPIRPVQQHPDKHSPDH